MLAVLAFAVAASATEWQQPPAEVMRVLHAPPLPWVWTDPTGEHMLLADPVTYPPLMEYAAGWHELAGTRVSPLHGGVHGRHGGTSPRLVAVDSGAELPLALPAGAEVHRVAWTVDGDRFALTVSEDDHFSLWVGDSSGAVAQIEGVSVQPLVNGAVRWMPDQKRLLVLQIPPDRGPAPSSSAVPPGPAVLEGAGASARSTYEARNLLKTAHDDALFSHFMTSEPVLVDPQKGQRTQLGAPAPYTMLRPSPSGKYLLVEYLVGEWSHAVGWWRFATELEVWDRKGSKVATVASLPLADQVPIHGVAEGPRQVGWQATARHTLHWVEALDGGDPLAEVPNRDRMMRLEAPFSGPPEEVWKATHRIVGAAWAADGRTMMVTERERMKRWRTTWLLDVRSGAARKWFELNEKDRYSSPGSPEQRQLDNGAWVMHQEGDSVYFSGSGASPDGDRPFLDLRSMATGETRRLFRCAPDRYERFIGFAGDGSRLIVRSESPTDVPNYLLAAPAGAVAGKDGEAEQEWTMTPITQFEDPSPELRQIKKQLVTYEREDGVPLSFQLYLPPGHTEGERLPTVVYAYPLEYSDASTAGQVRGSTRTFDRMRGPSHMFFLLQGYAVLDRTAMPMVGDPETVYDTFVPQLVADAEAAVTKAVEMGVADPDRIGVIGHSHGGLMVANLLAHTDLFQAGIARSGSYNKTNQPFGFQSERRSLFEAQAQYIALSPTFYADQIDEPVLVIHGAADSNPGTLTFQSEVFFEGVRGSGGTARLVLLPFEDHGYRAKESVEHVLWEQLRWFDTHLKAPGADAN